MCGISGILNFSGAPVERDKLEKMNELIFHRGPDGDGIFVENNIGLGSNRLAIIDLREIANQPMFDFDKRYVIVYNGEIFNYVELRDDLVKKGYKFNNNSDTEVILNLYKEYGEKCQHKLNGMWAFAIWDRKEKTLFCSRDRYGIKPFYYYRDGEKFIFGSEIKQILSCGVQKQVNDEIVYDYLVFNFIDHIDQTFFKNIYKLPAGFKVTVKGNDFKINQWYELPQNEIDGVKIKTLYEDFYNLMYDSIRLRLRSDVEVGSCLSGGLDSSTVVCLMHNILHNEGKPEIQKTYTACYEEKEIDERKYAEEVINQTNSTAFYLYPDSGGLQSDFDKMTWHQDEPFIGATVFAQWSVFKKIHETKIKVVLDGQGSDEILMGYYSFVQLNLKRTFLNPIRFVSEYLHGIDKINLSFFKFSQFFLYFISPFLRYKVQLAYSRKFLNSDFLSSIKRKQIFYEMVPGNLRDFRLSNLWQISLPSLLRYEDKNSMAFSVEARLPFLDHRVVEFIFSIPFDYLIRKGWTKYVLRESMKDRIPDDIRLRKGKLGFTVPQKKWFDEIKPAVIDSFANDFRTGMYINRDKLLNALRSGACNDKFLHRAFCLERWMKVFGL